MQCRIIDYISRIGKSRGFGIQSPWAYGFVRDVITEKLPYYAYSDIERRFPDRKEQKKQKLYFRIRNFIHGAPFCVVDINARDIDSIRSACTSLSADGVLAVEGISSSANSRARWAELRDSDAIGITFDLYDFAICFMPNAMFKQHYKLNF